MERLRQRLDAFAERLALIGEGELGAMRCEHLGDAPSDRVIVGDAHNQAALALHQSLHIHRSLIRHARQTESSLRRLRKLIRVAGLYLSVWPYMDQGLKGRVKPGHDGELSFSNHTVRPSC